MQLKLCKTDKIEEKYTKNTGEEMRQRNITGLAKREQTEEAETTGQEQNEKKGQQNTSLRINKLKSKEKVGRKERNRKKLLTPQNIQNHNHSRTTRTNR